MNNLQTTFHNVKGTVSLFLRKHGPMIAIVGGVVGLIGSTVMASVETAKLKDVTEEYHENLKKVDDALENGAITEEGNEYTEEDGKKDIIIFRTKYVLNIAKLYAPSFALILASATSVLVGAHILNKRILAVTAAYATLENGFKKYREQIRKKYGDDVDHACMHGELIFDEPEDDSNAPAVSKPMGMYTAIFDETNPQWKKSAAYNKSFLIGAQNAANDKLRLNGHLFLNEVYDLLDIDRTPAGQMIGWIYDKNNPSFVDFGLSNYENEGINLFNQGYERSVCLEFNPDGNIMYKI